MIFKGTVVMTFVPPSVVGLVLWFRRRKRLSSGLGLRLLPTSNCLRWNTAFQSENKFPKLETSAIGLYHEIVVMGI